MLIQQQTKIQFESLETLQAIQKQAYQMLMQGLTTTGCSMCEGDILNNTEKLLLVN
ncbi:transcription regulator [Lactiplantibacillus plantarum]|uniref:Transcription regulator n=2 Tax=Lactiplantibacillus plantarum TaxID=1590 RepID=A0AAW3RKN5_LACPN|nr:transcription regulator [Lactiplantibacillus plantarum WJL]KPN42585.1 putative transcriptional regulator [Lactiplantibacillus plantarum WJL]KZV01266.1 transcription regulator [Lactiplantibacillus plantarum]KZV06395.1 transcription regulator [Lactiplantibacillus plantarum]